ncbi:Fe-S cluster assembly ATPase SufC [Candidatus Curtissbacteria bacterium]|nr:Fe-S cluster assembly ATPase SufC [Candidatus Curtissbacteria bacterium]
MKGLAIKNLSVSVAGKRVVNGLDLTVKQGEVLAFMGPNGSGKSSLAMAVAGSPKYIVESGQVLLNGVDLLKLKPDERAKKGLFVSFQHPVEVAGVTVASFLRMAYLAKNKGKKMGFGEFGKLLSEKMEQVGIDSKFASRELNVGFSGGEKKKLEVLQLLVLEPEFVILDELDSGLDIDSVAFLAKAVSEMVKTRKIGVIVITHYERILKFLKPDKVGVFVESRLRTVGGREIVKKLEKEGYVNFREAGV